jgi:hypothetical protein
MADDFKKMMVLMEAMNAKLTEEVVFEGDLYYF